MNNFAAFSNPAYQPIQTPVNTKFETVFTSQIQNTNTNDYIEPAQPRSNDNVIIRQSAQFGQDNEYIPRASLSERELRDIVRHKRYVACIIF